jgi:TPR repeat protein
LPAGLYSSNGVNITLKESKEVPVINQSIMSCMTVLGFFCWLTIIPSNAVACGWWGDGQIDDDDDVTLVDDEGNPVPDDDDSIYDPETQTRIGNRYESGKGVARNYKKAMNWYRKAAEKGFAGAQNNLAVMYEQGRGVPKDESEAAKWYRRAAEGNDAKAQHSLGIMYRDGRGVPRDLAKAAGWIHKSAEQGHHGAFRDMGEMYWKGSGVAQNSVLAYMWWRLGAVHGDKESERLLSMAAVKMTAGSIKEAEILAQERIEKDK